MTERERLSRRGLRAPGGDALGALALLALAGASGCVPVFDYPLGDLTPPSADAASDTSVESGDGAAEAQADASVDASGDVDASVDASGDVDASVDADASDASIDAVADVTSDDVTADAVADVATDAESGATSPGVGALGAACATTGDLACAGHAVKQQLVCGADLKWGGNGACSSGTLCDSRAGANQGTCATIDALCATHQPNETFCNGQDRVLCGPDLVSSAVTETCVNQACTPSACVGVCQPGRTRCSASTPETCDLSGHWQGATACTSVEVCGGGMCGTPPSCLGSVTGQSDCGPGGNESCCTSLFVTGGTYSRSYDGVSSGYTDPQYTATIADFHLDKYEITVGRFRAFVDAVLAGWTPAAGTGKHGHLHGGNGLGDAVAIGAYETGWDINWNADLPTSPATWDSSSNLYCHNTPGYKTWTSAVGANERLPINCLKWDQAQAFCIWDGGFLPSEAEWNYAAAGGSEQRMYPWGPAPAADNLAVYCGGTCWMNSKVGSAPDGNGRWGHADLAGSLDEWTLDAYASPYSAAGCENCAALAPAGSRVLRGGSFNDTASALLSSSRFPQPPGAPWSRVGARCARSP